MKKLIITLFITFLFHTSAAFAHSDHGKISPNVAINIAIKTTQQLTFKDFGFNVGKLNENWMNLSIDDYSLYATEANRYIVSASNKVNKESIYFFMSLSGEILQVNSEAKF
ncbi:DUF6488 family protein [Colwellia sp. PAMC 21821]|uniref:DUF6488 family protein n=1 Tax=Colwellia sp. PAMC 21821 TaxID=1816219 RepID=UPI0009BF3D4C|nr:DUF6488 family protein [Colwellia sp. PAMC 21821]ARD46249.1 hypothetical protein A3Q33_19385 [Colwellia sp. PAMC 21821]